MNYLNIKTVEEYHLFKKNRSFLQCIKDFFSNEQSLEKYLAENSDSQEIIDYFKKKNKFIESISKNQNLSKNTVIDLVQDETLYPKDRISFTSSLSENEIKNILIQKIKFPMNSNDINFVDLLNIGNMKPFIESLNFDEMKLYPKEKLDSIIQYEFHTLKNYCEEICDSSLALQYIYENKNKFWLIDEILSNKHISFNLINKIYQDNKFSPSICSEITQNKLTSTEILEEILLHINQNAISFSNNRDKADLKIKIYRKLNKTDKINDDMDIPNYTEYKSVHTGSHTWYPDLYIEEEVQDYDKYGFNSKTGNWEFINSYSV